MRGFREATVGRMDRLVLSSPDAAIAAVPHILGFAPRESLVLIWSTEERLLLTQRMDAPERDASDDVQPGWIDEAVRHGTAAGASLAIVIAFRVRGDAPDLPGRPAIDALEARLAEDGIDLLDALLVDAQVDASGDTGIRWWSYRCDGPCCPPAGRPLDPAVAEAVAAAYVMQGSAPFPSREALAASLESDPDSAVAAIGRPTAEAIEPWRDVMLAGPIARLLDDTTADEDDGLLLGALQDVRVRDSFIWELAHRDDRRRLLGRLARLLRAARPGHVAAIATVTAVAAWLCGDGARAVIAVERALADDPDYTLALLLAASLRLGLPPSSWLASMERLTLQECRHGRGAAA